MVMNYWIKAIAAASCFLVLTGCKESSKAKEASSSVSQLPSLPAGLFVQEPIEGAKSVSEVKADLNLSGEVVGHGRIGGRSEPFVDGVAVFILADSSMKSCDELHDDACKTPWDYCCEPTESLSANIATIQIVDANEKPLSVGIQGKHGLEPLARVAVAGHIVSRENGNLVISAKKISVRK